MHGMDREAAAITGDPRRSGQVTRYHTWPRLREQSIAEHSWQLCRILFAIWPDVPFEIVQHALFHDIGEIATGDLPFPTKMKNPQLKKIIDDAEYDAHLGMCIPWGIPKPARIAPREKNVFKLAEYIEMWEWALDELAFGNSFANPVRERCMREIEILKTIVDEGTRHNVETYIRRRLK